MIEVIYINTIEQWVECASHNSKKNKENKGLNKGRIFLTAACAVVTIFTAMSGQVPISIMFGALGIIFYFFYPKIEENTIKMVFRRIAKKRDLLPKGDIKVVLDGETLKVEIEEKLREIDIREILGVSEISRCLFIEFKGGNQISLIIPLDAFKSNEDREEFRKIIE